MLPYTEPHWHGDSGFIKGAITSFEVVPSESEYKGEQRNPMGVGYGLTGVVVARTRSSNEYKHPRSVAEDEMMYLSPSPTSRC